jgi:lipid A 3-O-deacylase
MAAGDSTGGLLSVTAFFARSMSLRASRAALDDLMRRMPLFCFRLLPAAAVLLSAVPFAAPLAAQTSSSQAAPSGSTVLPLSPVRETMTHNPWNWGAFFSGGTSVSTKPSARILTAGVRAGKVLTDPIGPSILRGQFEYSAEVMPWWQGHTDTFTRYNLAATPDPEVAVISGPYKTGGAYNGISLTPIVLRWDLSGGRRIMPFVQGAGGVIWTNHKFPPVGPYPAPGHQGTSVWNFTPQFGVGMQYFLKPRRSITFNANAVHVSNASLGDANPGLNATVQFQIGYSWWK